MEGTRLYSVIVWGCGRLGSALASRLIQSGLRASQLLLVRRNRAMLEELQTQYGTHVAQPTDYEALLDFAQEASMLYVFYAVPGKSAVRSELCSFLKQAPTPYHVIVCSAGIDPDQFDASPERDPSFLLLNVGIVRAYTGVCLVPSVHYANDIVLQQLLDSVGIVIPIKATEFSAATALSCSAVALFAKLVQDAGLAGTRMGMHYQDSTRLLAFAAISAGELLLHQSAEQIIDQVATPRGCTVEGLLEMDRQSLSRAIQDSLISIFERLE